MSTAHTLELLRTFLAPAGVSGCETDIAAVVQSLWAPLADEVILSPLGSVHGLLHGTAGEPRSRLMVSVHMDTIGMIVSGVCGEFLRLAPAGGFDPRILPGQSVCVLGRQPVRGTLLAPPQQEASSAPTPLTSLWVDCGRRATSLQQVVRLGDPVCLDQPPILLGDSRLASPRLDNRVSLAALTLCMETLADTRPHWDFAAAAVVREEIDDAGSTTSAFSLDPKAAIALDTTFGRAADLPAHATFPLGAGLSNAWGPAVHPALFRLVEQAASECGVSLTAEFLPNLSGTDADHIQLALSGVPTAVLSIPVLNMHTPVEIVDLEDIQQAARLLTAVATQLGDRYRFETDND